MSIAQVRVGDYMEECEVFFNNTLIPVKNEAPRSTRGASACAAPAAGYSGEGE
jgi:transposase-like protein